MRKLVIALLMALIAISLCLPLVFAVDYFNLCEGRTATASDVYTTFYASKAIDGDIATYWASTDEEGSHWWQIDLGVVIQPANITIRWQTPPSGQTYSLETSNNGLIWTNAGNYTLVTANETVHTSSYGRYWRIYSAAITTWMDIYEVEVFGDSLGGEPVSIDSTSVGALVVAIFLVLLNVLLIIKPVPLLGFSVAMITFGSVLVILGYSMPYAGMFAMMLSVVSVISIARSAKIYRGD